MIILVFGLWGLYWLSSSPVIWLHFGFEDVLQLPAITKRLEVANHEEQMAGSI